MCNWINVEDRLPEYTGENKEKSLKWSDDVIGCVKRPNDEDLICFVYYANNEWCYAYGDAIYKKEEVTHWMPLPLSPNSK